MKWKWQHTLALSRRRGALGLSTLARTAWTVFPVSHTFYLSVHFFPSQSRFLHPDYIYGSVTALPGSFYSNWMSRQNVQKYLKERAADKHSSPVMETHSAAALKKNVSEEGNLHSFPRWFSVTWHRRLWRRSRKNTGVIHNNDSLACCDVERACKRSSFPLKEILPNCPQMTMWCKKREEKVSSGTAQFLKQHDGGS